MSRSDWEASLAVLTFLLLLCYITTVPTQPSAVITEVPVTVTYAQNLIVPSENMTDTNLASINSGIWSMGGASWSQEWDYTTYHDISPSMRIGPHNGLNPYREIDGFLPNTFIPGDRLVWRVWVKTGNSTLGQNGVKNNGAVLNWDWYNGIGRLHDHSSNNPAYDLNNDSAQAIGESVGLPFNNNWTLLTLDCIVPTAVLNQQYPGHGSQFETPNSLILNPIVSWYNPATGGQIDDGLAWFSDPEFYINPSGSLPPPVPPPSSQYTP